MNIVSPDPTTHSILYSQDRRQRNLDLQWLRAIAAFLVVLYHASGRLSHDVGDARFSEVFGDEFGIIGVAIFFAISGALMVEIVKSTDAHHFLIPSHRPHLSNLRHRIVAAA